MRASPNRKDGCKICGIVDTLGSGLAHRLKGGWILSGNIHPSMARPALVLSTETHRKDTP